MRRHSTVRRNVLVLFAVGSLIATSATAAAATPPRDATFGTAGLVTNPAVDQYHDVLAMADGSVVAAAGLDDPQAGDAPGLLVRYDVAGAPVASFGTGGTVAFVRTGYRIRFSHVEHGPGATLVAFGGYMHGSADCGLVIARVDAKTGKPDAGFASSGLLLRRLGPHATCMHSQPVQFNGDLLGQGGAVMPDGRMVLVGQYTIGTAASTYGAVVLVVDRFGAPSAAFGGGDGKVRVPIPRAGTIGPPHVATDGKVVVGLSSTNPSATPPATRLGALRLLPTGARDTSFSHDGLAWQHPFGFFGAEGTVDLILQSRGRVVAATGVDVIGSADEIQNDTAVVRFSGTGTAAPKFNNGKGFTRIPRMFVDRAVRAPDGSVLLAGAQNNGPSAFPGPLSTGRAAHVSARGVADTTFGTGGAMDVIDADTNQSSQQGVAVGTNGALTYAGWRSTNPSPDPSVATRAATLTRFTTVVPTPLAAAIESGLSHAHGGFRPCGASRGAACHIRKSWHLLGNAWPLEAHDPARVLTALQRHKADGTWGAMHTATWFVTDAGNVRAVGKPWRGGTYRIRLAVPASSSTTLTQGAWNFFHF